MRPHRKHLGPLAAPLAAALLCAALAGTGQPAQAQAAAPAAAATTAADAALPEAALRAALQAAPGLATADARLALTGAEAAQRRASPYDWVLRAGLQRRNDSAGPSTSDRELALERTLRWTGKPALDARLGDQLEALGTAQRRLAWHDEAGALLGAWFELARDARSVAEQRRQLQLAEAQLDAVRRRVRAGDAAVLEQRQAEGERERSAAALARAEQRWQAGAHALRLGHPLLAALLPSPEHAATGGPPAEPGPTPGGDTEALAQRILNQHPALAVAGAELALARLQQQRVAADRTPDPTVGLRLAQERSGAERVLGLTLSVPFGPQARDRRLAVETAQAALVERQGAALRARLGADAARAATEPQRLAQVLARLQAAAAAAQASAGLTERARAAGEAPLAELLLQRRQAGEAALAAELARIDLHEAQARLQLALGQLLPPP